MNAATARREDSRLAVFLALVACVGLGYTAMAADMDWRTSSGLIGPGFFPLVLGVGIVGCSAVALARLLFRLRRATTSTGVGESTDTRVVAAAPVDEAEGPQTVPDKPWVIATAGLVALMVGFVIFLQPLGAVFGSMLFMLAALQVLNPGRWISNVVLSVAVPVGLYLLLQTLLAAGLPPGPIPV